ncbi:MAG: presqualene diphosphate synthase HpnD [Gammaproteobacteria bacterium]|nr:presqualene diphosphate synthase HpnD [Gammaproteobacteria bacterium]
MTPDQYCEDKAAKSGSSFYYSFRFLPDTRRKAITALYAFCREVDDVVDETSDPAIALQMLNWWRNEIDNLFNEHPTHPVSKALVAHINPLRLQKKYFLEIIDGMQMDLDYNRYRDMQQLELYCYRVASAVGLLSVEIFGYQNSQTLEYARDLGMAFQLTNIIRDVREDAQRERIYLPQSLLDECSIDEQALRQNQTPDELISLLRHFTKIARQYYQSALSKLPDADRYQQRPGIIMAEIYLATLDEIENDGFKVLDHRVKLTPLRKLWIAWRVARSERKRYKKQLKK